VLHHFQAGTIAPRLELNREYGEGKIALNEGERAIGISRISNEHLRHGNNCSGLFVTNWIVHRITSSQSWVNILCFTLSFVSILRFSICYYASYTRILMFKLIV
jgi:hypothetical protein